MTEKNRSEGAPNIITRSVEGQKPSKWNMVSRHLGSLLSGKGGNASESWRVRSSEKNVSYDTLKMYVGKKLTAEGIVFGEQVHVEFTINEVTAFATKINGGFIGKVRFEMTAKANDGEADAVKIFMDPDNTSKAPVYPTIQDFDNNGGAEKTTFIFSEDILKKEIVREMGSRLIGPRNT